MKRGWVCVVVMTFVVAACGGSSEPVPTPNVEASAGDQLIATLGSEQLAADALIIAMDRGYSGPQILTAAENVTLRVDGTIEGESPAGPALNLVLYEISDEEGDASSYWPDDTGSGDLVLIGFRQPAQTPIERLRDQASGIGGTGQHATNVIISLLSQRFEPEDIIEALILGIDDMVDNPDDPDGPTLCLKIVDELICPGGDRMPAPTTGSAVDTGAEDEAASPSNDDATQDPSVDEPVQLVWQGELTANPDWVDSPVAGTYEMTRTNGSDDFQITLSTTDAKSGTFTTDGFNEVECTSEWTSVFEGTGTFWDINDLGIEFTGEITRSITYTSGPCDENPETTTDDFSGVVVRVTEQGIESSFNAWDLEATGPPPRPVDN